MVSQSTAGIAWDIDELHNQQWIKRYRPECATACGNQPCGKFYPEEVGTVAAATASVWIQDGCYYPGSVNYVIFGVMCKLCFDFYVSISDSDYAYFSEKAMQTMIWSYKGGGLNPKGPSPNFHPSQQWAKAGYHGWPSAGTPGADRPKCTRCPISYLDGRSRTPVSKSGTFSRIGTGEFSIHWVPEWHVGIMGWTPFADPGKEGWIGGPDKSWKPPSPP